MAVGGADLKDGPDLCSRGAHLAVPLVRCRLVVAIHLQCNHNLRMGKNYGLVMSKGLRYYMRLSCFN